jgi:hypothetical protein
MVAAHAVVALKMADDRLDGGPAAHLAADRLGDPSHLAGDADPATVRIVAHLGEAARNLDLKIKNSSFLKRPRQPS